MTPTKQNTLWKSVQAHEGQCGGHGRVGPGRQTPAGARTRGTCLESSARPSSALPRVVGAPRRERAAHAANVAPAARKSPFASQPPPASKDQKVVSAANGARKASWLILPNPQSVIKSMAGLVLSACTRNRSDIFVYRPMRPYSSSSIS